MKKEHILKIYFSSKSEEFDEVSTDKDHPSR